MARIQILNGPNVNLIGTHHQNLFGSTTLQQLD
jgi:3-dehydroquinate dehydratase